MSNCECVLLEAGSRELEECPGSASSINSCSYLKESAIARSCVCLGLCVFIGDSSIMPRNLSWQEIHKHPRARKCARFPSLNITGACNSLSKKQKKLLRALSVLPCLRCRVTLALLMRPGSRSLFPSLQTFFLHRQSDAAYTTEKP